MCVCVVSVVWFVFCSFLQYFDTVGWVFWPIKTVSHITYTVLEGTLNTAQSNTDNWPFAGPRSCRIRMSTVQFPSWWHKDPSNQVSFALIFEYLSSCLIWLFSCFVLFLFVFSFVSVVMPGSTKRISVQFGYKLNNSLLLRVCGLSSGMKLLFVVANAQCFAPVKRHWENTGCEIIWLLC